MRIHTLVPRGLATWESVQSTAVLLGTYFAEEPDAARREAARVQMKVEIKMKNVVYLGYELGGGTRGHIKKQIGIVNGAVDEIVKSAHALGGTTRAQAPVSRRLVIPLHRGLALGSWWTGASVTADDPNRRLAGNRRNEGQRSRRCTRLL